MLQVSSLPLCCPDRVLDHGLASLQCISGDFPGWGWCCSGRALQSLPGNPFASF